MLENLKKLLGIEGTEADAVLKLIVANATARLTMLLGGIEPPETLNYIIVEVSIARYNKIGSEGLSSHSVEGESLNFVADDFGAFADDIQAYLDNQKEATRGKVRFL
jgi:hypothetical protein